MLGPGRSGRWCGRGELGRDRRPRGIRVAPAEVDAPQARSRPGTHERTDLGAALVEDDREVWHVGGEPRQVRARCDHPGADEDRDVGLAGVDRVGVDRAVTEPCDEADERADRLGVAADRDHGRPLGHGVGRERGLESLEQRV
ncbi:MAG TPA: hypothetical protein VFR98_01795, partial [Agromyces sp.]|nr:hypothetical protein [Agromyces sp.]